MLNSYNGFSPVLEEDCWIAENAMLLGNVHVSSGASVWYGAVLRGDQGVIHIGKNSNIQDLCVLHSGPERTVRIGKHCSIGHRAVLHGCEIGDDTLIGIGAIILDGARIGRNCTIGAGCVLPQKTIIPDNSIVVGVPGRVIRKHTKNHRKIQRRQALQYIEIWRQLEVEVEDTQDTRGDSNIHWLNLPGEMSC